jgi:hypothetical protein
VLLGHLPFAGLAVDFGLFLGIASALAFDLSIRLWSFDEFESVSIDAALFTTIYSAFKVGGAALDSTALTDPGEWWVKFVLGLACVLVLSRIHSRMYAELDQYIKQRMTYLAGKLSTRKPDQKRALERFAPLIKHFVLLTFVRSPEKNTLFRQGKRERRRLMVEYVGGVAPDLKEEVRREDFLLPFARRRFGLVAFFFVDSSLSSRQLSPNVRSSLIRPGLARRSRNAGGLSQRCPRLRTSRWTRPPLCLRLPFSVQLSVQPGP